MEAVFETAYRGLPPDAARLYRLLGLLPGSDFTAALAGALAGGEVRPLIGTLLETYLVVEALPERYRLHELVRRHAAHAAEGEPAAERDEALRRAVAWYSRMVTAAHHLVVGRPGEPGVFDGPGEALDWLESERGNLLALLRQASTAGWDDLVRRSAEAMSALYANRKHYADWLETSRLGTLSAHRLGDRAAEAGMRDQTARALIELGDYSAATAELDRAAAGVEHNEADAEPAEAGVEQHEAGRAGDDAGAVRAVMVETRGLLELARGRPGAAAERFEEGVRAHEALGDTRGQALLTFQLGRALAAAGRDGEAAQTLESAAGLAHDDELTRGRIAIVLGQVYRRLGRTEEAERTLRQGTDIMRARRIPFQE
ncbi:hypothetical protein ACIBEJ_43625 [Nonomuraea sp. NPDC050790]|uniref:hypothetical protein n=1 Tax=Nonomuraea sp. NPDC050790 TaxID=3364371 RepID=UPI00379026FA